MNVEPALTSVLAGLRNREATAERRVRDAEAELTSVRMAIQGIEGLIAGGDDQDSAGRRDAPAPPPPRSRIIGMEAVDQAVKSAPNGLTLPELTRIVQKMGWEPDTNQPERSVRSAANRLRKRDKGFVYEKKRWYYRPLPYGQRFQVRSFGEVP